MILLKDSNNVLLYTFPLGSRLENYHLSKRVTTVDKALQHGGDVISDKKYELQHISITGVLGSTSTEAFEAACTLMKKNADKGNLRLYCYKDDQYFDIKMLEDIDFSFLDWGGAADFEVHFLASPFRLYKDETVIGPTNITASGQTVAVYNGGDIEVSPTITYVCDGTTQTRLRITNTTNDEHYFEYSGDLVDGDELKINCSEATVTKNGTDAIDGISTVCTFYSLEAGTNIIKIEIDGAVSGTTNTIKHEFRTRYF